MKFIDIFRRNRYDARAHEANDLLRTGHAGFYFAKRKYSDVYLWLVVNRIFGGLRSVRFYNSSPLKNEDVDALCDFVMKNAEALVWQYWDKGYMVIDVSNTASPELVINPKTTDGGHVFEPAGSRYAVVYSPEYQMQGLSAFKILQNEFKTIDTLRSGDEYLTESLGALGIISGKEMPMTPAEKEAFLGEVKKKVGITPDKFQFLIATGAISYTPIAIPVADLNLRGKVTETLKLICDYFSVPFDLINFSGASTYANMEQAVKLFYSNCIAPIAEQLLLLIRHAVKLDTSLFVASDNITFGIDNTDIATTEQKATLATLETALKVLALADQSGIDTTEARERIAEKLKTIEL